MTSDSFPNNTVILGSMFLQLYTAMFTNGTVFITISQSNNLGPNLYIGSESF